MQEEVLQVVAASLLFGLDKVAGRAGEALAWQDVVPPGWQGVVQALAGDETAEAAQLRKVMHLARRLAVGGLPDSDGEQPGQLLSIFCDLTFQDKGGEQVSAPEERFLPLKMLQVSGQDAIFSGPPLPQAELEAAYRALWLGGQGSGDGLKGQLADLKRAHETETSNGAAYVASLLKLLERYCWCIPAGRYQGRATISLYDQNRLTAALAVCLIDRPPPEIDKLERGEDGGPVALLVGGDISGVQDFIYTISSRGAASALRGRSLYLQLLTDAAARYILRAIGLSLANLIYAGGGHFYLLAPATAGMADKIKDVQRQISRILLRHHQGDLYLAVAETPLAAGHLQGQSLSERWKGVGEQLQQRKQRRFSELGADMAAMLFTPLEHGGNDEQLCAVCSREHPQAKEIEETTKCPPCLGFEDLGRDLRGARYLCLTEIEATGLPQPGAPTGDWEAVLAHFGYRAELRPDAPPADAAAPYREVLALEDDAMRALRPAFNQAVGRRFLVNVTPRLTRQTYLDFKDRVEKLTFVAADGESPPVKPFEIMAYQAEGIKRLGVLRMDVDNLGQIFSTGLGAGANLARVGALSFSMSLFFEGWVEQIAEGLNAEEGAKDLIYAIYSGGDDLFFVGAWHLMPELAERISRDLARYSGFHPGIHLSGGIALAGSKYPLYQAAEDAHRAEQGAKTDSQADGVRKNALNFLGKTIPWPRYAGVKKQQQDLANLVATNRAPTALLRRLAQLYGEYRHAAEKWARTGQARNREGQPQVYWGPWHWQSAYSLARLAKQNPEAAQEIEDIRQSLNMENFTHIEWLGLAARWAELLLRKGEEDGD